MKKIINVIMSSAACMTLTVSCNQKSGSGTLTAKDSAAISEAYNKNRQGSTVTDQSLDTANYRSQGVGNFLIPTADAARYIQNFEQTVRSPQGETNPNITRAVWFDTAALSLLAKYIKDPANRIDGIRMHFMAYDQMGSAEGQATANQMSVVMVPTHRGRTEAGVIHHTDDWSILQPKADALKKLSRRDDGLNHGQLCPTVCD